MTLFRTTACSSKARKRWGQEVFVSLFSRVVAQCVRAGLVEGTKIHADSSLMDAHASLNPVRELDAATRGHYTKRQKSYANVPDDPGQRYFRFADHSHALIRTRA